jgi:hypothetical protein
VNLLVTVVFGVVGFRQYGIVGFIAAYGLGNLMGHVVVMLAVAQSGHLCPMQDLGYTMMIAIVAALGCWYPSMWSMDLATSEGRLRALLQGSTALASTLFGARVVWTAVIRR